MRAVAISQKILVIEDDPSFQRYLSFILEKEGYQVVLASNGLVGLRKAKEESPDLLISDVMLPGLDGFEICHRLRSDPATAGLPILMLSAKGQESDKQTASRMGANEFYVKPVDRQVLLNKVKELLAGKEEKGDGSQPPG